MLLLYTTHTLGSNSTVSSATPGQSVVVLIIFAALYCGILVLCALLFAITWCWCWCLCSHLKDMKVDMSKDTRVDTQEDAREEMRDDNTREEMSEGNKGEEVKEDLREDNLINGLYAFLKKTMKGTDIQFRALVKECFGSCSSLGQTKYCSSALSISSDESRIHAYNESLGQRKQWTCTTHSFVLCFT